jgi:hypothetical protein
MYPKEELCEKIRSIYPDIGQLRHRCQCDVS